MSETVFASLAVRSSPARPWASTIIGAFDAKSEFNLATEPAID
jgi:hypothetical protein